MDSLSMLEKGICINTQGRGGFKLYLYLWCPNKSQHDFLSPTFAFIFQSRANIDFLTKYEYEYIQENKISEICIWNKYLNNQIC